jgi:hypothetical protein
MIKEMEEKEDFFLFFVVVVVVGGLLHPIRFVFVYMGKGDWGEGKLTGCGRGGSCNNITLNNLCCCDRSGNQ